MAEEKDDSQGQADKLPVTTSSIVTESKGTFMGLDGMGFFVVMFSFVMGIIMTQAFTEHAFIFGAGFAAIMFIIMRVWIGGKPDGFLKDALLFFSRPKLFEHRPRDKRPIFR